MWSGDLSGITALNLPRWVERYLYEPGKAIAQIEDWPAKLSAIAARTASRNITLLAGIPSWLLVFAEVMRNRTGRNFLKEIWPGLECVIHGGVPIAPFEESLRTALGEGVRFHEVYPASEGFIAAQDSEPEDGLRLLSDAGVFYEFIPLSLYDEERVEEIGHEARSLAEIQPGVDYVLLMTTPAGLCRYIIGDVVRFITRDPPRLIYVGRTRLQLSAFGEHVIEKEITDALTTVSLRHRITVINFHVAPIFPSSGHGAERGRHEWFLELQRTGQPGKAGAIARELDYELQSRNEDYEAKRKGGGLAEPMITLVSEGTFERWMRKSGKWGGQSKMPRCSSDRRIADELKAFDDRGRNENERQDQARV
jgi:hypothetical protein